MLNYHPESHLFVYWMIFDQREFKTGTELKEKIKKWLKMTEHDKKMIFWPF